MQQQSTSAALPPAHKHREAVRVVPRDGITDVLMSLPTRSGSLIRWSWCSLGPHDRRRSEALANA